MDKFLHWTCVISALVAGVAGTLVTCGVAAPIMGAIAAGAGVAGSVAGKFSQSPIPAKV